MTLKEKMLRDIKLHRSKAVVQESIQEKKTLPPAVRKHPEVKVHRCNDCGEKGTIR